MANNISIDADFVINEQPDIQADLHINYIPDVSNFVTREELAEDLADKQDVLIAGENIQIEDNVISATDTTYTAGEGISIVDNVISNTQTSAEWGNIEGDIADQTDLTDLIDTKIEIEATARENNDLLLQNGINTLNNDLTAEISNRGTADGILQNNINTLSGTVSNNYTTLDGKITDEATARGNADSTLDGKIGDNKTAIDNHIADKTNPHEVTKAQVGLGNVDNTSDLNKPISTATQTALDSKVPTSRTVNSKALTSDITLTASDVDALPNTTTINDLTTAEQQSALNSGANTTNIGQIATNTNDIEDIEALIPNQATSSNQLADKDFVNSSIATNTANFIGTFESVSNLEAYSGAITNNDYAFVINSVVTDNGNDWATFSDLDAYDKDLLTNFDYAWVINGSNFDLYRFDILNQEWVLRVEDTEKASVTLNTAYNRYKASVSGNVVYWEYEYTLNNSSFTASQWEAINSGITSELVTQIGTNQTNIGLLQSGKQDTITGGASTVTSNNLTASKALVSNANGKIDVADTTLTQINYLKNVTSDVQGQLNLKLGRGANISELNNNLHYLQMLADWEQPILSSNGTMGGDDFAVASTSASASSDVWKAFDGNSLTSVTFSGESSFDIIFYVPTNIDISNITMSINTGFNITNVLGSNDGLTYSNVTWYGGTSQSSAEITITDENSYKYYKIEFSPYYGDIIISEVDITATYIKTLSTVAYSGSYNDLDNKPTIPTVGNGTITINQGGVQKGTFTTNQSGNTTIDLTAGSSTDVQINGTSITSGDVANIVTNTAYNSSTNKIATMSDVPAAQVQSNWNETDTSSKAYIQNKPTIPAQTDVKINNTSVTSSGVANIVTEGVYDATDNKIATMSDLYDIVVDIETALNTINSGV